MATLRELKGRIGSVASSEKITGAMKMISSAKMHKAEGALRRLVPFRNQIETIIGNLLSADAPFSSPLTRVTPVEKISIVVFGSDDGLCGAYNVNLCKALAAHISSLRDAYGLGVKISLFPIGKKMEKAIARLAGADTEVISTPDINSKSDGDDVKTFLQKLQQRFLDAKADKIDLAYMKYYSAGRQRPQFQQLLPLSPDMFGADSAKNTSRPYIFEPDAGKIYRTVLPMYQMAVMQDAFSENRASEQAARVMAMQSANDNAKKLLDQLQLEYNKLRQQSITSELLDIIGGQKRD